MLNAIWLVIALTALLVASLNGPEQLSLVVGSLFSSAKAAIQLVIGLVGVMVFFLGLMRVVFDAGLRDVVARTLTPITRRLFPEVPSDHPAMGAMIMNMASNMLGMANAATPFGLKAMSELSKLNRGSGSASNAMVLFLAINASAVTILPPLGTIGVRAAANSSDPWAIWMPTLFATTCSTATAVTTYYLLYKIPIFRHRPELPCDPNAPDFDDVDEGETVAAVPGEPESARRAALRRIAVGLIAAVTLWGIGSSAVASFEAGGFVIALRDTLRDWALPALLIAALTYGFASRVRIYDAMVAGGRDALAVATTIVPYLVVILVALGMFRASGALDVVVGWIDPFTSVLGVPAEVLPMALMRPLSGSGALGVMSEILEAHGPDSFIGLLTCTLMGSTETTFYVLAVYLGAAGVVDGRHALFCCLAGDIAGFFGAVAACHFFFG
ncbi:MAG: spore maturation protein [Deltaproteobacteria bacterium]|nr:spore maturation protein [Deltaproteobacteria bacterium]